MKRWLLFGMTLMIVGCSDTPPPAPDTRVADEKAIREGEIAWVGDFKAKDPEKLENHYADDALVMTPGAAPAKGKDAILAMLKEMVQDKNLSLTFTTDKVVIAKGSDIAYTQGSYEMTSTDPKTKKAVNEKGTYVTVYKKEAGGFWKAIEDINTPSAAPTPVAGAKPARAAKGRRRKK